jgi:hypothetical protein
MSERSVVDGRPAGRPVVEMLRPNLDVLLETKLQAPRVRREWVQRPGLVRVLDDLESKLILVDAPAGYGKTTLLAQWGYEAAASRPFAWISLDRGDDDPARLWQHVICSLQRAFPDLRAGQILRPLQRQVPGTIAKSSGSDRGWPRSMRLSLRYKSSRMINCAPKPTTSVSEYKIA